MNNSLANTGVSYVPLQAYVRDNDSLHIQGTGLKVNRDYGVAVDIDINNFDEDFIEYFNNLPHTLSSKVSEKMYFPLQAKVVGDSVHFQISGPQFNRSYGASFDAEELYDLIDFINLELE